MKTVYIPKGETVHYESLVTEHLVVHGHLHVTYGIKAKSINGKGVINAGTVEADTVCVDDVEAASVICKRLLAKRVQSPEVFASESAAVSCFLSAAYVETGKLTVAISEIDVVEAQEVVNLPPRKRSLLGTLLASVLRSFWTALTVQDMFSRDKNKKQLSHKELLEHLKDKDPAYYYTDILVPNGRTLGDFINRR